MFHNRKKRRSTTESFLYSLKKNFLYFFTMLLSHQIPRYSVSHHENTKFSSGLSALYKALLLSSIYWRARRIHMKTLPIRYTSPYFFFLCVLHHLCPSAPTPDSRVYVFCLPCLHVPTGLEGSESDMEPCQLQRCQRRPNTTQPDLEAWHPSV